MVLPSLIEGFGHVILEAMSSGLPVICTTNTAGPDLFLSHNEGFIIPIRDSDAIVASLDQLLTDKSKLKSMGRSAAATARIFTWERHIKGIQDFYLNNSN
jgi:glycosyltransferase involved in cell wall biosynthesis